MYRCRRRRRSLRALRCARRGWVRRGTARSSRGGGCLPCGRSRRFPCSLDRAHVRHLPQRGEPLVDFAFAPLCLCVLVDVWKVPPPSSAHVCPPIAVAGFHPSPAFERQRVDHRLLVVSADRDDPFECCFRRGAAVDEVSDAEHSVAAWVECECREWLRAAEGFRPCSLRCWDHQPEPSRVFGDRPLPGLARPSRSNSPRHREHRHPGAEQPTRTGYRRYGPRGPPLAPRPALRGDLRPTAPAVRALGFNPRPRAGGAGCVIPTSIPRRCFSPRPREGRLLRCAATGANQIRSTTSSPFGRAPASTCTA